MKWIRVVEKHKKSSYFIFIVNWIYTKFHLSKKRTLLNWINIIYACYYVFIERIQIDPMLKLVLLLLLFAWKNVTSTLYVYSLRVRILLCQFVGWSFGRYTLFERSKMQTFAISARFWLWCVLFYCFVVRHTRVYSHFFCLCIGGFNEDREHG